MQPKYFCDIGQEVVTGRQWTYWPDKHIGPLFAPLHGQRVTTSKSVMEVECVLGQLGIWKIFLLLLPRPAPYFI